MLEVVLQVWALVPLDVSLNVKKKPRRMITCVYKLVAMGFVQAVLDQVL